MNLCPLSRIPFAWAFAGSAKAARMAFCSSNKSCESGMDGYEGQYDMYIARTE
jgi:hypothetical protein